MTTETQTPWVERVREADADAEEAWKKAQMIGVPYDAARQRALIAIAAELRAARIARRPGGGQ